MATFGRNRQSIADLEQELLDLFLAHPRSHLSDDGQPVIPGDALVDVLRTFSDNHNAVELMTREEEAQLVELLDTNPGLAVTPQVLLQFIAMRTGSPRGSPDDSPERAPSPTQDDPEERGRPGEREFAHGNSRSSSRDSVGTSVLRPPSRGPAAPSPFDGSRRQRSTPLANAAPSSWTRRRPPPSRRTGSQSRPSSDSESAAPPSAYTRPSERTQAPSNPTTPTSDSPPSFPRSRPHSRAQSQPQPRYTSRDRAVASPEHEIDYGRQGFAGGLLSPPPTDVSDASFGVDDDGDDARFARDVNTLLMPRARGLDADTDEDEDATRGLVLPRSAASSMVSMVSMDQQERLDALQRMNTDLARKLIDAERTLQNRLAEHELDLEEMQGRLDEAKAELSATKREEKELRAKERSTQMQMSMLESEISQLQKSLQSARASYQSLQKQYQEQCAESERYRNMMRMRDQEIKDLKDAMGQHTHEASKWLREQAEYEERITFVQNELALAQQAQIQLDEQRQENLMLKETIDRMRFDMDELRNSAPGLSSSGSSMPGTISKSLGVELMSKMKEIGGEDKKEESSQLEADEEDGEDTEGEDVVETIITRTKRKVASRANRIEPLKIEEVKEFSDAATQYDAAEFTQSCDVQTEPEPTIPTSSLSVQTDEPLDAFVSVQAESSPRREQQSRSVAEMETQTDDAELSFSMSSTPSLIEDEDTLASSSSTLLPPTPKAHPHEGPDAGQHAHAHDLPPDYNLVTGLDRDALAIRVADETLRKWHKGLKLPIEPIKGGISEDAIEDWKALKAELGVECAAIERIVDESARTGLPRLPRDGGGAGAGAHRRRRSSRSRFYNIYNTYVYDPDGRSLATTSQVLFCIGASAAVAFILGQAMAPQYVVPGGATYPDRAAWSSFNSIRATGEGFPGHGPAAVWNIFSRLGGGAARTIRNWPV